MNYYNEYAAKPAAALRQLIADGLIPMGEVDERSIKDVRASDLRGFTQCHFFAGIGGWSQALALASWRADRPVWTGSCPCQPFSTVGKKEGGADDRDLWPVWFRLIKECRPASVYGEQVASAIPHGWLDRIYSDMEPEEYALAAAVLPACSVNAPHERERLWFVAKINDRDTTLRRKEKISEISEWQISRGMVDGKTDFWDEHDWFICEDGKQRRIPAAKSGISAMVDGFPERVGMVYAAGNAIVPEVAARFIRAAM